ncbi:MAG: RagB/SusD family nutrient uptake outer membrane protein [Algibacter sp.]
MKNRCLSVTTDSIRKHVYLLILMGSLTACTDFVEVELPKQQISTEAVFNNPATVDAAFKSIYIKMRDFGLLNGGSNGLNILLGLYTDELELNTQDESLESYQNHTLLASNASIKGWWDLAYNQVFAANAILEGIENSVSLTTQEADQFKGEALFIRAYLHVLLVELFGDIPYITTTDHIENTTVSRLPRAVVYDNIIADLILATDLLPDEDVSGQRTRPYATVAEAVLARAYLYTEQWTLAEAVADKVIIQFGALEPDLDKVFLKDGSGTIWQFKPNADGNNTSEGAVFIFTGPPEIVLTESLFFAFESGTIFQPGDQRQSKWINTVIIGTDIWRHAFKYRERNNTGNSIEYPIQLRLAEQYLIRAEARAQLGDVPGAQADINAIRNRAGLGNTTATTLNELLEAILQERRVELFAEKGHRWFDLKRMGKTKNVLEPIKVGWKNTDILLPIPASEIALNPNLLPQNDGY